MNDPERTPLEPPGGRSDPTPHDPSFMRGPERLALAIYGACLVLVLVLYHFQ